MPNKRSLLAPVLVAVSLVAGMASGLQAQSLFRKPVKVLGDPQYQGTSANPTQFTNNGPNWTDGREFSFPFAVAVDNSVSPPNIYVADAGNNRVMGFRYGSQLKPGTPCDIVIGQVDKIANLTSAQNGRSTGLNTPSGLAVDSAGNLYVADSGNNRILRYPKPFGQNGQILPDLVIGQTSLSGRSSNAGGLSATSLALGTSARTGMAFDVQGSLWVADSTNNRVLRYPASLLRGQPSNGPAADLVLGQSDFASRASALLANAKTGLRAPQALTFDSGGRLYVADQLGRILVYPPNPQTNAPATRIVGIDTKLTPGAIPVSQTQLTIPYGLVTTAAGLIVADSQSNRVLVFPPFDSWQPEASQFSPSATVVVGQPDFFSYKANQGNGDASASTFNFPSDLAASSSELFVADSQNNRVLVFPLGAQGPSSTAARVVGQLDFPYTGVNLVEGHEFNLSGSVWGSAILDYSATPPHLYVADTQNNRILGFKDFTTVQNGQKADVVIGQPDFFRTVVNYPSGDPAKPSAQGLRLPSGIAVDSAGNLYVADTGNGRILRFPSPFANSNPRGESADLVIGQAGFGASVTDASDRNMSAPVGIALTAEAFDTSNPNKGWLIATDAAHNRTLFFAKPFTSGMSATKVLGAPDFNTASAASSDAAKFSSPRGVAVDSLDRVLIADTGNRRIQIFNKAANIKTFDQPTISINTGVSQPVSISTGFPYTPPSPAGLAAPPTGFWAADLGGSAVLHFPVVDQLPLKNNASDGTVPVYGALSAFQDAQGNLLAADSANRVLYFAPQANIVSSANYSTRPQAAGGIVSLFAPAAATYSIAPGNGSATSVPLPTVLGDTKVLVNGQPVPLFFVSPGQINLQLPSSLPAGGTADVQVVQASTGTIVSAAEAALASASPAIFTLNGSGAGQVIGLNYGPDGSYTGLNSQTNPIPRGQVISLLGTGAGQVSVSPADGQAAIGQAPTLNTPQVVLGSSTTFLPDANVQYSGLAPGLVGVWQVNILIPQSAQTGPSVPIKIFLNSVPNVDSTGAVQGGTTIAIQ